MNANAKQNGERFAGRYTCLECKIVHHCAPTLAGIKPANMFVYCGGTRPADGDSEHHNAGISSDFEDSFHRELRCCREQLLSQGLRIEVLARRRTGMLLYVYRPDFLRNCIQYAPVADYLFREGYDVMSLSACIVRLHRRICGTDMESQLTRNCTFPHEIGFFLGYPYEDVVGFIENKGENYLCCGCWKVYAAKRDAEECFCCYRHCTEVYRELYKKGLSLEFLAMADGGSDWESSLRSVG